MRHILVLLILVSLTLVNCSDEAINGIAFQNKAEGDVVVNFRGESVDVPSGQVIQLTDIDKGEFEYETVYNIPAGATGAAAEGEMSGTFSLGAGTKILVVYSSVFVEGTYTIYASVTTSEDQSEDWWDNIINPINP